MRFCPACRAVYSRGAERCGIDGSPLVEGATDPLIGQTIEKYRVEALLGAGAMGRVYRAAHASLDRRFAIKVLFGDMASDSEIVERFHREASSLSRLDHPNVVSVVDSGRTTAGLLFFVMEYVQGSTLSAVIKGGPLDLRRARALARQIASGLAEAHRHGLVHRDLKPGNIMVSHRGPDEFLKIVDFGLVGLLGDGSQPGSGLTQTGVMMGTPAYMAPEQFGDARVGGSADVYALGVIAYEMLSGTLPFKGTLTEVMAKKLTQTPAPLPPSLGLDDLTMEMLSADPASRPTADAAVERLDRLAGEHSAHDRTVTPTLAPVQAPRRSLVRIAAAILTALALGIAAWTAQTQLTADAPPKVARELSVDAAVQALEPPPIIVAREDLPDAGVAPRDSGRRSVPSGIRDGGRPEPDATSAAAVALEAPRAMSSATIRAAGSGGQVHARVTIDGRPVASLTPIGQHSLNAGTHRLVVEWDGRRYCKAVSLEAGEHKEITVLVGRGDPECPK